MVRNCAENNQSNTGHDWPQTAHAAEVIKTRCLSRHEAPARRIPLTLADERGVSFWQPSLDDPRLLTSRHIVFNLSQPEKSLTMLAPLAKEAGGWGLCLNSNAGTSTGAPVFAGRDDPGYQAILALAVAGRDFLNRHKRFDMPGFVPRVDWFREMKRYGMIPSV